MCQSGCLSGVQTMKLGRLAAGWLALGALSTMGALLDLRVTHAQTPDPAVTLIAADARLANSGTMTTDGVQLYVGAGRSIVSVPITGGGVTNLYDAASPCCVAGLTRLGADLFWVDPSGVDATAVFRAPTFGGAVETVYPVSGADNPIIDGADITNDGARLYTSDRVQGSIHTMLTDGSSLTGLGTLYGAGGDHPVTILGSGAHLYIADSGDRSDVAPAALFAMPAVGGPLTTLHSGVPFVRPSDLEAANDAVFVADEGANTIWKVPAAGGLPVALVSGPPFARIRALAFWNNALYVADAAADGSDRAGAIYRIDLPNAPPFAADDRYSVDENGTMSIGMPGVLGNDIDGAGEHLTAALVDGIAPGAGTLTLNHDGSFGFVPASGFAGDVTFRYRASDGKEPSNVATATITVKRAPAVTWTNPAAIAYGTPLGAAQLNATAAIEGTFTYSPPAGAILDAGVQTLSAVFTPMDTLNYSAVTTTVAINVAKAPTTASLTLSKNPQQYSDLETFKATISSPVAGEPIAESVTFSVGTQLMGTAPLTWTGTGYEGVLADVPLLEPYPFTGQMQPAPLGRTARATFNNVSGNYSVMSPTRVLMIGKEDARAALSGTQMVFSGGDGGAMVDLNAIVKDISATSEAGTDTYGGDIRHAPVLFLNRNTGMAISPALGVALQDPNNKLIGVSNYDWPVNLGASNAQTFRIGVLIDRYFVRYNSADDLLVTVAKPLASKFITGGGHLVLTASGGVKAGDPQSRNDFGFAVSFKGSGSRPAGHFTTIVRSNGVYQINGAITSLVVHGNTAKFSGAASIYDITNGSTLVDGRARFDVSIIDAGEPGSSDRVAVTVRNAAGTLWFSSDWNGSASVEQLLAAGNITIR